MNSKRIRTIRRIPLFSGLALLAAANPLFAVPTVFNFRDTGATAEIESGIILRDGITATLTPFVAGGSGVLNQTASGFGINATGSGDATDLLDGVLGMESISVVFDKDVFFTGLALAAFTGTESASVKIAGFGVQSLTDTGAGSDVFNFATDNLVAAGEAVVLQWVSGNGFSLDSLTVEAKPQPAGVPDVACTFSLALVAFGGLGAVRRKFA